MKIAIVGSPGSGKSTLAETLHKILDLPLYHLDQYFWQPEWQRPDRQAFAKTHHKLCDKNEWIIEGMATRHFDYRIQKAYIVIFLDIPLWLCLYRVFKRALTSFGKVRKSSAQECPERMPDREFLTYIWNFYKKKRPEIVKLLQQYKNQKKIFVIKNKTELDKLIKKFESKKCKGNTMKPLSHTSAKPSHYDQAADHYDTFNEEKSKIINNTIDQIFKKHNVKTVLDLACGTGSQVLYLAKRGYSVVGVDINEKMLNIAKEKAQKENIDVQLIKGDMRTTHVGQFDAVITIFNAIGHLTENDFETALQNIHSNLKDGGLYIFDIFNLHYLMLGNNITKLTIDWSETINDTTVRDIQYSIIDQDGILTSYTMSSVKKENQKPELTHHSQTLQVYTAKQLKELLHKNGFEVIEQCDIDGSKFSEDDTERILTIAKKK